MGGEASRFPVHFAPIPAVQQVRFPAPERKVGAYTRTPATFVGPGWCIETPDLARPCDRFSLISTIAPSVTPAGTGPEPCLFRAEGSFIAMRSPPGGVVWLSGARDERAGAFTVPHGATRPRSVLFRPCETIGGPRSCETGVRLCGSRASGKDNNQQSCSRREYRTVSDRAIDEGRFRLPCPGQHSHLDRAGPFRATST